MLPGWWDGLLNSVTKTANEVSGGRNSSDHSTIPNLRFSHSMWFHDLYQFRVFQLDRHFVAVSCVPAVDHLMEVLDLIRPPAPARGPAHTSLCRWLVFVVDHWAGMGLSHPNVLIILVHAFVHTLINLLETRATVATPSNLRSYGRVISCNKKRFC